MFYTIIASNCIIFVHSGGGFTCEFNSLSRSLSLSLALALLCACVERERERAWVCQRRVKSCVVVANVHAYLPNWHWCRIWLVGFVLLVNCNKKTRSDWERERKWENTMKKPEKDFEVLRKSANETNTKSRLWKATEIFLKCGSGVGIFETRKNWKMAPTSWRRKNWTEMFEHRRIFGPKCFDFIVLGGKLLSPCSPFSRFWIYFLIFITSHRGCCRLKRRFDRGKTNSKSRRF